MNLQVYLNFSGNCKQALEFYEDCLNGDIVSIQHFKDQPSMPVAKEVENNVLHSVLKFGDNVIMASDNMDNKPYAAGGHVTLSLDFKTVDELDKTFNKLSAGGKVTMPLQDTFWGARFGMLQDQFGLNWMFNCELKKG